MNAQFLLVTNIMSPIMLTHNTVLAQEPKHRKTWFAKDAMSQSCESHYQIS